MKFKLLWLCCCCTPILSAQQTDAILKDTQHLPVLTITDSKVFSSGQQRWTADSLPSAAPQQLVTRLMWSNMLHLRPLAPGALSTISIRGAGAARSPVYWNGINLQSPMNGVVDAALIPVWPGDNLELRFGGQSAAYSSGYMGGGVFLEQGKPYYNLGHNWSARLGAGSFGQREANGAWAWSGARFSTQLRGWIQSATNDFPIWLKGLDGREYKSRQQNNALERRDFQWFGSWKPGIRHTLGAGYWNQHAFREIPPATTEVPRVTWQIDDSYRAFLKWDYALRPAASLSTKVFWLDDRIDYHLAGDTDTSRSRQLVSMIEYTDHHLAKTTWKGGLSANRQWASSDGYADSTLWYAQLRLAAYAMGEWRSKQLRIAATVRQEYVEGKAVPFTWSLGGTAWKRLNWHLSRNFNLPTFNDQFWNKLGSPTLRPENGYSAELGWAQPLGRFNVKTGVFHMMVDDWILWQPVQGVFRPENLRKVWSRGWEGNVDFRQMLQDWHFEGSIGMQFVRTTNIAVYDNNGLLGKQLPYTPQWIGNLSWKASIKGFSGAYLHQITGKRVDNQQFTLPGYHSGTLLLAYTLVSGKFGTDMQIDNLWNARYEAIRFRPMPGRSFKIGIWANIR